MGRRRGRHRQASSRALLAVVLLLGVCGGGFALGAHPARADEELDLDARLPEDRRIARCGTLPNGMRYWIRPHDDPKGAVDLTLYVEAGSIHETDDQGGYAHFVEHMAFNGAKHFPPGEVQRYFASVGIKFGHHSNAYTSYQGTEYTMLLRDTSAPGLRRALRFFSDAAQHISFLPAEVEQEKRVILEELRLRKNREFRVVQATLAEVLPGSRLAARHPLGDAASVEAADSEGLRDYYRRWYRPDRATLLVVGDVQPEAIEPLIREAFSDWAKPDQAVPHIQAGPWPEDRGRVAVLSDKELERAKVGCFCVRPRPPLKTLRDLRARAVEQLAAAMMSWRGVRRTRLDPHLMTSPVLYEESPYPGLQVFSWRSETYGSTWAAALEALLLELRRVELHGFGEAEFEQARTAVLGRIPESYGGDSSWIAQRLLGEVRAGTTPRDWDAMLSLTRRLIETITAADCAAAVRRLCDPRRGTIRVLLPDMRPEWIAAARTLALETQAAVARADVRPFAPLRPLKLEPPEALAVPPAPGQVLSKTHHEELGITTWTLENGARVHFKRLSDAAGVHIAATLLGGAVEETAANLGITALIEAALQPGRLTVGGLNRSDVSQYLAARGLSFEAEEANDGLILTLDAQQERLPEALGWLRRVLTDTHVDFEVLRNCKYVVASDNREIRFDADAVAWAYLGWFMSGQDVRTWPPRRESLDAITLEGAQGWMDRLLRTAPLEIGIYGDVDEQTVEQLVRAWVGSLPTRTGTAQAMRERWKMAGCAGPVVEKAEVVEGGRTGIALLMWRGFPRDEVVRGSALRHAATILTARLERILREKHGLTYALRSDYGTTDYEAVGGLFIVLTVDPARAEETARIAKGIAVALAKEGPTKEELVNCQKQWHTQLEIDGDSVGFWRSIIDTLRHDVRPLVRYAPILPALKSVDGELVTKSLREIVLDDRFFQILALPKK